MKALVFLYLFNISGNMVIYEEVAMIDEKIPIHSMEVCNKQAEILFNEYSNGKNFFNGEKLINIKCHEID